MPTNLLMWNVQFFTVNKIAMANANWLDLVDTTGAPVDGTFDTLMNLEYITSNLQYVNPPLGDGAHIFVLIENLSSQGTMGSLAEGNGAIGSRLLLDRIRAVTGNQNWMLVPPLKLVDRVQTERGERGLIALLREGAYTECISVFYRSDLLTFVGPYVWPAAGNNTDATKTAQPDAGQATGPYPDVWAGTYPANNYFAGQFEYFRNPVARTGQVLFPDMGSRRPFFTQFREVGGAQRLISLASVHYPPQTAGAQVAFATTTGLFGSGNYTAAANEVLLVGGDFNLNYLSTRPLEQDYLYGSAARGGFRVALDRRNVTFPTIIRRKTGATLGNYLGTAGYDNIIYRAGAGVGALNPLVTVYDRVNRTAPSMMYNTPGMIGALATPLPQNTVFRLQQNYSYMGPVPGVSDHLPVFMSF